MSVKLLTEHHLEFLSLKGGCTGSSQSTLVKMSNCWNSYVSMSKSMTDSQNTTVLTYLCSLCFLFDSPMHNIHTGKCIRRVLPVLPRPEVVDIGVNTI